MGGGTGRGGCDLTVLWCRNLRLREGGEEASGTQRVTGWIWDWSVFPSKAGVGWAGNLGQPDPLL